MNKLDEPMIKTGLNQILEQNITWPPNLPKFIELCSGPSVDTNVHFDLMIKGSKPTTAAQFYTKRDVGFQCKAQLPEKEARKLYAETYLKYLKLEQEGKIRIETRMGNMVEDSSNRAIPLTDSEKEAHLDKLRDIAIANGQPLIGALRRKKNG